MTATNCKACSHDKHAGRCFVIDSHIQQCACLERISPDDADLGVDEGAIATYQLNQDLRQHGEVIIVRDEADPQS